MALSDCAAAAVTTFPAVPVQTSLGSIPLPVVMVAIAGSESGWVDDAQGDYGLSGPSCSGYTSWGLWQIHSVHSAYLEGVTGSTDPCAWASWLYHPLNCAQAALALSGPDPTAAQLADIWTTFADGSWAAHLEAAQAAVAAATGSAESGAESAGFSAPLSALAPAVGLGVLVAAALAAAGVVEERRARR